MTYLIECPNCEATMGASVKAEVSEPEDEQGMGPYKISLVACPKCGWALVGIEDASDGEWSTPSRVWPYPPLHLSWKIPPEIRNSLEEANKCIKFKSYTASIAMSGRALEAIGRHFYPAPGDKPQYLMLGAGLKKLYDDKVIDTRLYQWGKALNEDRNLAAHSSGTNFKKEDAEDVFKFTNSICEYVFVLSRDFNQFMERGKKREVAKTAKKK